VRRRSTRLLRARPVAALVGVLVALSLGACARIPTSGPVVDGPVGEDYFRPLPQGPAAGATPAEVVRGFLGASLGADEDYEVARTYMQPRMAGTWRPSERTLVYSGEYRRISFVGAGGDVPGDAPGEVDEVTARIDVEVIGVVDSDGQYAQQPPGTAATVEMTLRRDAPDRQWRISATPDLALLSQNDFRFAFRPYRLYFLDPTLNFLVPDQRWFPESDSTTTRLVAELLDGPAPWLEPAVDTAFPAGTRLAAPQAVTLEDTEAKVPMTSPARGASGAERRLMRQQLLATLRSPLGVTDVLMSVDGAELSLDGGSTQAPRRDPQVASEAVLLRGEVIERLDGAKTSPVRDLPSLGGLGPSHPATGYGGATLAVLVQERSELRTLAPGDEELSEPLVVGADLTAPSFDWRGWVWTSPAASAGTVLAALPGSGTVEVEAPWLAGRRVGSLRVSRDGTRVVVASTGADGSAHVDVTGVVRTSDFQPVRLTDPLPVAVGSDLALAEAAVWVDENRVAVLGRRSGDDVTRVLPVEIGGLVLEASAPVPGAVTLAAARGDRSLLVSTSDRRLLVQQGAGWAEVPGGEGTRQPAFEG